MNKNYGWVFLPPRSRFPTDKMPVQRKNWIRACRYVNWEPKSANVLCSDHFEPDCYSVYVGEGGEQTRRLNKWNAVPTLFDFPK